MARRVYCPLTVVRRRRSDASFIPLLVLFVVSMKHGLPVARSVILWTRACIADMRLLEGSIRAGSETGVILTTRLCHGVLEQGAFGLIRSEVLTPSPTGKVLLDAWNIENVRLLKILNYMDGFCSTL